MKKQTTPHHRGGYTMSSHVDSDGNVMMVDISDKPDTARTAVAEGRILVSPTVLETIRSGRAAKGDVLTVAQLAGITAAKRTADLIPLCHPLALAHCKVLLELEENGIRAECTVKTRNGTGVEMEALTGVSVALLTVYDMCKSMDKSMTIEGIRLLKKSGGKSGDFTRT
jgi:cyclic pyranopterin phosphate synthase